MEIRLTLTETSLLVPEGTELVCSNDLEIRVQYADAAATEKWERYKNSHDATLYLHFAFTQDTDAGEETKQLSDAGTTVVRLPGCQSVRVYLYAAKDYYEFARTETSAIVCKPSVLDLGTSAYSPPFDAYNAMMQLINGRMNGRLSQDEINALLAQLSAHSAADLNRTAYKRAIAAMSPETRLTGALTLANEAQTEIEVTNDTLSSGTVVITTNALRDDFVLPGAVPSSELQATIPADAGIPQDNLSGAKIDLTFEIMQENGQWGAAPLGEHTVYSIGDDTATGIPVTAYDAMKLLDSIPLESAGFTVGKSYSPGQIIQTIATTAGLAYTQNVDFDNAFTNNGKASIAYDAHSYVVAAFGVLPNTWTWGVIISNADPYTTDEEVAAAIAEIAGVTITYKGTVTYHDDLPTVIEDTLIAYRVMYGGPMYNVRAAGQSIFTARDLLMHTVTTLNGFAYIERATGELKIKPISKETATSDINPIKTLRQRVSRLPYRLYCLQTVCDYPDKDGIMVSEERREYTLWSDGVTATMQSNPLYIGLVADNPRVSIFQSINAITDALDPVHFKPTRVETYGDPSIEPWEWISVETKNGTVEVPAAEIVWRYRGTQTIDSGGSQAVTGLEQSQAAKAVIADKLTASQSTQNVMRDMYGHLMTTHGGLHSFRHEEIGHYTYAEIGRKEDDE